MPGLTLVTGGPASGKTERLLDVVSARYQADPFTDALVLVPTARHGDQFRQRLVRRVGIAVGLDVTTLRLFASRLTAEAPVAPQQIARELLARVTLECAAGTGAASRFAAIARTRGLHALVRAAVSELAAAAVDPGRLAECAISLDDPDLRALAEVYAAYMGALQEHGWEPPEARARIAAALPVNARAASIVAVDGVQFLEPGEAALIAALAAGADVWVALDGAASARARWTLAALQDAAAGARIEALPDRPSATEFEAYSTADDEAQLREVARSVKRRLTDDPSLRPSHVAVVARRIGPHLAAARRVFREFDLPLDPAAGEPLAEQPFGIWTLRLLRLGVHGWRLLDVLDVCGGGFFAAERAGFRPGDLERLRRLGRAHVLWSGLDALRRLPDAARAAGDGSTSGMLLVAAAEAWSALLDRLGPVLDPETLRTSGAHAALVAQVLFGEEGLLRAASEGESAFAVEAATLRRDLDTFRAVEEALRSEPLTFAAFVDRLEREMQRPATLIREAGGVLLAPMHTLHGLRFRDVYLMGLAEGEFPAPGRAAGLLSADIRGSLAAAGIALPPQARATEDELWRAAVSRAANISLWHPRFDAAGRPAAASYYLASSARGVTAVPLAPSPEATASTRELALSVVRGWPGEARRPSAMPAWELVVCSAAPVEQRRRSFASAGRFEARMPGADTSVLVDPAVTWSASRLEAYRTCPFQFFSRYGLRLYELDEEQPEADAATRGVVMHAMIEDALAPLVASGRFLDDEGLEEALRRLFERGRKIWDDAPRAHAFGREALWRHQGDAALERLVRLLQREATIQRETGITAIEGGERQFNGELPGTDPPLVIQARVDRVDRGEDVVQVVDYKTGKFIRRSELESGDRLQLQLYALVARTELGAGRVVARYAFLRGPKGEWLLDSDIAEDAALLEGAVRVAAAIRDDVASGRFDVAPRPAECPRYCAARTVCRVNQFSRTKTWS